VNNRKFWQTTTAVIAFVAVLGVVYLLMGRAAATSTDAHAATELVARKSRLVRSTVARGLVKPQTGAEVKVGSQVSGIVRLVRVSVGQKVKKGQILAELDDSVSLSQVNILRQELNAARVQKEYADRDMQRIVNLTRVSKGTLSDQAVDEQARKLRISEVEYDQAAARLKSAQILLGYTKIVAPIDGTIASISTYEGETVAASFAAPTFVNIIDLSRQEIQSYVDEADIGSVRLGQPVDIRLESFPDRELRGVVRAINPKPEVVNNVVNYVVLVDFAQPTDLQIRPEMTARVDFVLEVREKAIVASNRALIREDGVDFIVVKIHGVWRKQAVETGLREAGKVEIVTGLQADDTYLADREDWIKIAGNRHD
jgi:RND family efflux transporter MFP subunit